MLTAALFIIINMNMERRDNRQGKGLRQYYAVYLYLTICSLVDVVYHGEVYQICFNKSTVLKISCI